MSEQRTNQVTEGYNNQFYNTLSALQIRLDVTPIYEKLENSLRGNAPTVLFNEKGVPYVSWVKSGEPKCNEIGVQSIMSKIVSMLNNQVVQGNLKEGRYEMLVAEYREDFTADVILNCYEWEIKDDDLSFVIDLVIDEIELFLTRLIDNKERDSYAQTMKIAESNVTKESQGGGIKLWK